MERSTFYAAVFRVDLMGLRLKQGEKNGIERENVKAGMSKKGIRMIMQIKEVIIQIK